MLQKRSWNGYAKYAWLTLASSHVRPNTNDSIRARSLVFLILCSPCDPGI